MKNLFVRDCVKSDGIAHVLDEQRPARLDDGSRVYAVYTESVAAGKFCGLVTVKDICRHPNWVFADLCREHDEQLLVRPDTSVEQTLALMDINGREQLPVIDKDNLIGIVTRAGIFEQIAKRKTDLLEQSKTSQTELEDEHKHLLSWSNQLAELHALSRDFIASLVNISFDADAMKNGLDILAKILKCQRAAISVWDERNQIDSLIHIGFNPQELEQLYQFAEDNILQTQTVFTLLSDDPSDSGEDAQPALGTTFYSFPLIFQDKTYGQLYLSKETGTFDKNDELFVSSFTHTLSLAFDNAKQLEAIETATRNLDYLAHFDVLTGLPNRVLLIDRLKQALTQQAYTQVSNALLFIDIDDFKLINESLGHQEGDKLLVQVAERLSSRLFPNDSLVRFAGDAFVILLNDIRQPVNAVLVAEKIISAFEQPFMLNDDEVYVSVSIGIVALSEDCTDENRVLADAEAAMHQAKSLGKKQYHFYSAEMNTSIHKHFELEMNLRKAIEKNELLLFYQPMIDVASGKMVGFEALLRWHSEEYGPVSPTTFIPVAEQSGLIVPIGEWVIDEACHQARKLLDEGINTHISVNLSGKQFHPNSHLFETVSAALNRYDLPASCLGLEITENIMMNHLDDSLRILDQLKQLGLKISVDDFGTGYSSLSYIKQFPIDILKIDKSFIDDLVTDKNDVAIVTAIIAMAKQLNLEVVVEGIETEAQLNFFTERQHDVMVQGYYFSRPLPANYLSQLYKD